MGIGKTRRGHFGFGCNDIGRGAPRRSCCNIQLRTGLADGGRVGGSPCAGLIQQHFGDLTYLKARVGSAYGHDGG